MTPRTCRNRGDAGRGLAIAKLAALVGCLLWTGAAAAQCEREGETSGEARRELAVLLANRETLPEADFEAALLPIVQRVPCVPAAVLPLAEAQLAQGKRQAALTTLATLASIVSDDEEPSELQAAQALLTRLRAQTKVVLVLPHWVPEGTRPVVTAGVAEAPTGAATAMALTSDGPRRFSAWLDPGDYKLRCEGPLIEEATSPAALLVPPADELTVDVTPTPIFLPLPSLKVSVAGQSSELVMSEAQQAKLQEARAAAVAGDWPTAAAALDVVRREATPPQVGFNLAVALRLAGQPLLALTALSEVVGLPAWATEHAERHRRDLETQLARVDIRAEGIALRVDDRPVAPHGSLFLQAAAATAPAPPMPSEATLWLAPGSYRFQPDGPDVHRMLLEGPQRTRDMERPGGFSAELQEGQVYRLTIERKVAAPEGPSLLGPAVVLGAGAVVGVTSFAGFFLPAQRLFDDAGCDDSGRCADLAKAQRAQDRADVATVGTVVAGALLVGGAVWMVHALLKGKPKQPPPVVANRHGLSTLQVSF